MPGTGIIVGIDGSDLLLGSVSTQVIHYTSCPVVVFPADVT